MNGEVEYLWQRLYYRNTIKYRILLHSSCTFLHFNYHCLYMYTEQKIIILNAGTKTREAFLNGIGDTPYEWYHTKNIMLHIAPDLVSRFIYKNTEIKWSDSQVFTRLRGTDNQFCGIIYDYLQHNHIRASDPINKSYENSAEKISQMQLLALNGINIPETFIFREESYQINQEYIESRLAFPLVFKTDGSQGRNVHFVETVDALRTLVENKKPHILALIQPFIENTFDTRTLVAYGTILGSIKRSRTTGFLNNIAQGAIPEIYTLTDAEKEIALKATKVCGMDIAGVDIIHTETGPVILEVNKSPQVSGFESAHGFKVFEKIGALVKTQMYM